MSRVSVINIEETIGKTVGNRRPPNHLCPKVHSIQRAKDWQEAFRIPLPPKEFSVFPPTKKQTHG